MKFLIYAIIIFPLCFLNGEVLDWGLPIVDSTKPILLGPVLEPVLLEETPYSRINEASEILREILDEAGLTYLPSFSAIELYTPIGIKWTQIYRNDLSFVEDMEYREELRELLISYSKSSQRRTLIKHK